MFEDEGDYTTSVIGVHLLYETNEVCDASGEKDKTFKFKLNIFCDETQTGVPDISSFTFADDSTHCAPAINVPSISGCPYNSAVGYISFVNVSQFCAVFQILLGIAIGLLGIKYYQWFSLAMAFTISFS